MFKFELVPKWVWLLIGASVILGIALGAKAAINSYNETVTELATSKAATNSVLEVNASLNGQIIKMVQDNLDRENTQTAIDGEKKLLNDAVDDLGKKLLQAQKDRKDALLKAGKKSVCEIPDPKVTPPEISISWKAYCKASNDPKCSAGSASK